jgi:DNA-directed RNA polymerase sigma subunit (sigma70/sigma32)
VREAARLMKRFTTRVRQIKANALAMLRAGQSGAPR